MVVRVISGAPTEATLLMGLVCGSTSGQDEMFSLNIPLTKLGMALGFVFGMISGVGIVR